MTLWFILAMMTAAAVFAVLWPLGRTVRRPQGSDLEVYRDQLSELDRDRQAGLVGDGEYEAARTEVARRLIAAADAEEPRLSPGALWRRRAVAVLAFVLLPSGALGLYLALGSPLLPDAPLAARKQAPLAERPIQELVAQVEAHLEKNPEEGRGWEVVAPVYMRLGRFEDAVKAFANVLRLNGVTADRQADYGEALVAAANGVVTKDARAAFEQAHTLDQQQIKARYYLGLAAEQEGDRTRAAELWRKLLADAPRDAAWAALVRRSLTRLDPAAAAVATGKGEKPGERAGPDADAVAAAAKLSPEQRATMIHGMVERLAAQLQQDGSDAEGWQRLIRAYMVLGERDKAKAALTDARRAIAGDPEKLQTINELSRSFGLGDS
jgi:cytochrome c-type biogenesis protein CcmH